MYDQAHVRFLAAMDDVHRLVSGTDDIEAMLQALLDRILGLMDCDRAWLLYPCDPQATTWWVPMERTVAAWPGANERNLKLPMTDEIRYVFEAALAADAPVTFDAGSPLQVPPSMTQQFGIQAQMILAVHPKTDRAWMLGIHHCSQAHVYTDDERLLFTAIGRRLGDALSTLIALRDLRANEVALERTVQTRTAALQRSNRELEQFAYVASHDLREPLRAIIGYSELLAEDLEGRIEPDVESLLSGIVDGGRRMQRMLDDLLQYARLGTGDDARRDVELSDVVTDVLELLHQPIVESDAEIRVGELPKLFADPTELVQMLQNLVANAIKFRGDAKPHVDISAVRGANGWEIAVADRGIGIDPAHQAEVFDVFRRLHGRSEYAGSGIGLAVVKKVVQTSGGRVHIESELGKGTRFVIFWPDPQSWPSDVLPAPFRGKRESGNT